MIYMSDSAIAGVNNFWNGVGNVVQQGAEKVWQGVSSTANAMKNVGGFVMQVPRGIGEDIKNFNPHNTCREHTLNSNVFSMYRDTLVIRIPGSGAMHLGVTFLGQEADEITVGHEWGHSREFQSLTPTVFMAGIGRPSLYHSTRTVLEGEPPYPTSPNPNDYYSQWWEVIADMYAGIGRTDRLDAAQARADAGIAAGGCPQEWGRWVSENFFERIEAAEIAGLWYYASLRIISELQRSMGVKGAYWAWNMASELASFTDIWDIMRQFRECSM